MIKLNNVGFRYKNGNEILKNLNLEIKEGECVCIVGKNGSGKSTLAKLIAGIEVPKPGAVLIDEYDTLNKDNFIGIRKKVGIVFQNPDNQILFNNVYEDLAFAPPGPPRCPHPPSPCRRSAPGSSQWSSSASR